MSCSSSAVPPSASADDAKVFGAKHSLNKPRQHIIASQPVDEHEHQPDAGEEQLRGKAAIRTMMSTGKNVYSHSLHFCVSPCDFEIFVFEIRSDSSNDPEKLLFEVLDDGEPPDGLTFGFPVGALVMVTAQNDEGHSVEAMLRNLPLCMNTIRRSVPPRELSAPTMATVHSPMHCYWCSPDPKSGKPSNPWHGIATMTSSFGPRQLASSNESITAAEMP